MYISVLIVRCSYGVIHTIWIRYEQMIPGNKRFFASLNNFTTHSCSYPFCEMHTMVIYLCIWVNNMHNTKQVAIFLRRENGGRCPLLMERSSYYFLRVKRLVYGILS